MLYKLLESLSKFRKYAVMSLHFCLLQNWENERNFDKWVYKVHGNKKIH